MLQIDEKVYGSHKERLEMLFDAGTFVQLGAYTKRATSDNEYEGVLCGYGAVNDKLCFAFLQDSGRTKGAFGERHAKKIADMYELALKNGAPVIGVFDSAGAVIYDGAAALAAYGKFMKCVSDASGIIPQLAIVDGVCGGASAVVASMFDFTVTIKDKSQLYFNSPFAVGDEAGKSAFVCANGMSAYGAQSTAEAYAYVKGLVNVLPSNNADGAFSENGDDMNRRVAFDAESYKTAELLSSVCDNGVFTRVYAGYTDNMYFGFASFGGITTGIVASNPEKKGILDIKSARAAAKLVSFCDAFAIPVLTLADSEGLDVTLESENAAYASELARLAYAYTTSKNAKLTVVLGKAYGSVFSLLGSKAVGADMALALPTSAISVLSPEASVAFAWNAKVGEKTRDELEAEWKETCASAASACDCGAIDDVVAPEELRARICSALSMLASKAEEAPTRRHANMPL